MAKPTLRESADLIFSLLQVIPAAATITRQADGAFLDVNTGFERIMGYTRAEVIGQRISDLRIYADPEDETAITRVVQDEGSVNGYEARVRTKSGELRDVLLSARAVDLAEGLVRLVVFQDITERKRMEAALRESEERYRALTHSASDAIVSADQQGNIISWNSGAERIFGYAGREVIGRPLTLLIPERHHQRHTEGLQRFTVTGEPRLVGKTVELTGRRKDGDEFPLELSLATWTDAEGGRFFTGILRDMTQRKDAERKLHEQNLELAEATRRLRSLSLTDELTGLNNRRGFLARAEEQLKLASRMGYVTSLLFLDVDELKRVNDSFGHPMGDVVLGSTAGILRTVFRESDLLARIGGDEFAVLAINTADDSVDTIRVRLRSALAAFNEQSGFPFVLSFSVGQVVIRPDVVRSVEELLAEADIAMYTDKLGRRPQQQG